MKEASMENNMRKELTDVAFSLYSSNIKHEVNGSVGFEPEYDPSVVINKVVANGVTIPRHELQR